MRARRVVLVAVAGMVLAACSDERSPTAPSETPLAAISDGAHSGNGVAGNPDFFFLPPLLPSPRTNSNFDRGHFNPHLSPTVKICDGRDLTKAGDDCAKPLTKNGRPAVFPAVRGWDGLPDWVDPEQYHVLWQTRDYNLVADGKHAYRILVKVGNSLLGYLDVVPTNQVLGALRITAGGQDVGWLDDFVVPIRFRIETGALCPPTYQAGCVKSTLSGPAQGGQPSPPDTVVLPSGDGALVIPAGAVAPGDVVNIEAKEQAPPYNGRCLPPAVLGQSNGCYHFSAVDSATGQQYTFHSPVKVEICVAVPDGFTQAQADQLRLFKYNPTDGVQQWPWADPTEIDCSGYSVPVSPAPRSLGAAALRTLGQWAERLLAPRPLYAATFSIPPKGIGGTDAGFSDFGGGLLSSLAPYHWTDNPQLPAGSTVYDTVIVRDTTGNPVDSVHVTFRVTSGGGKVAATAQDAPADSVIVTTDANGFAGSVWTLGQAAGTNTLTASAYQFVGSPVTFTVTATAGTVGLGHFNMNITTLPIGGMAMPYELTLNNTTGATVSNVSIRGTITQNGVDVDAGTTGLTCPGAAPGDLPPGSCLQIGTLAAASSLTPGTGVNAHLEVRRGTTPLFTINFGVTLVTAVLPTDVTSSLVAAVHVPGPDTGNIWRLDPWATAWVDVNRVPHSSGQSDRAPAYFTNGQTLAFAKSGNIYRMNSDGTGLQQLTFGAGTDAYPAVSPLDGSIAFVRGTGSTQDIWVMNADGSGLRNLTNHPATYFGRPAWSPDGARIVFSASGGIYLSAGDIFQINASGTSVHRLTHTEGSYEQAYAPAWSPTGHLIAFAHRYEARQAISVMSSDGSGTVVDITHGATFDGGPVWSPDTSWIAFTRGSSIYLIRPDGSDERQVAYGSPGALEYGDPSWPLPYQSFTLPVASLAAGGFHSCEVTLAGKAYCWGGTQYGEVGNGLNQYETLPVAVAGGLTFTALSAGEFHTCGLTAGGAAYCWGLNAEGELGNGQTSAYETLPVAVAGGHTFAMLSAGGRHTCGIGTDGVAYCWGDGQYGQLGTGSTTGSLVPVPVAVPDGVSFSALSADYYHTCGVTTTDAAYCWGLGGAGELGQGYSSDSPAPVLVTGGHTFAVVATGSQGTCGLTTAGAAYCWGVADRGALGNGGATGPVNYPVEVSGGLTFAALSKGELHTCGLTADGAAYCWGRGDFGQIGNGGTSDVTVPTMVSGGLTFAALSAGSTHACGLTTTGAVYCWGYNPNGQLGNNTIYNLFAAPVAVIQPPTGW